MPVTSNEIVVIGGGAAGMMAALSAAQQGAFVTLLERNEKLGRKLNITGKGRCNLTNNCTAEEALAHVPCNSRFLFSAFSRFDPQAAMNFFEYLGLALKTERGNRVFPVSDCAYDVTDALRAALRRHHVRIVHDRAQELLFSEEGALCGVRAERVPARHAQQQRRRARAADAEEPLRHGGEQPAQDPRQPELLQQRREHKKRQQRRHDHLCAEAQSRACALECRLRADEQRAECRQRCRERDVIAPFVFHRHPSRERFSAFLCLSRPKLACGRINWLAARG